MNNNRLSPGARGLVSTHFLALVLAGAFLVAACSGSGEKDGAILRDEEAATLVSEATAGVIPPGETVRVRFAEPQLPEGKSGLVLSENPFTFSPDIRGTVTWSDRRTLELAPARPLEYRRSYRGELDLTAVWELSEIRGEPPIATFDIAFETLGPEVLSLEDGWIHSDDGSALRYWAEVVFTVEVTPEDARRAFVARLDGRRADVEVEELSASAVRFSTEAFPRGSEPRKLDLEIRSGPLELSENVAWSLTIPAEGSFAVDRIWIDDSSGEPRLAVRFSEQLSPQSLEGLIRTEPETELTLDAQGETVIGRGDLRRGETYTVVVGPGIQSRFGDSTTEVQRRSLEVQDLKPRMEFLSRGVFLPSTNRGSVFVRTVNLRKIRIEVKQVFENNLGQFLQTESMTGAPGRNQDFGYEYVQRVGVVVASESLEIGEERNRPLVHELDLAELLGDQDAGLFLLSLSFEREDMIYDLSGSDGPFYGEDYYSDPRSWGYLWTRGRIFKPVMPTDIALTWKQGESNHTVFATDIPTGEPIEGARIEVRTYQNQVITQGQTDEDGVFQGPGDDRRGFYVLAEHQGQRGVLKANEMAWNLSTFDVGGRAVREGGLDGYLFTERGVYRPGDPIHLSGVFRLPDAPLPEDHPVALEVRNSRGQVAHEAVLTEGHAGVYTFTIPTAESDPTGTWRGEMTVGDASFALPIRVETIVPERIAIDMTPDPPVLSPGEGFLELEIEGRYLFGAPASGLETRVEGRLSSRQKRVESFPGFVFSDQAGDFESLRETLFDGSLDPEGRAIIGWELPPGLNPPGALTLEVTTVVSETGGRGSRESLSVPVEPFESYVGLERPDFAWGYAPVGQEMAVRYVVVDADGEPLPGRPLEYRLYQNRGSWWWEYDSYEQFQVRYRRDAATVLVEEGRILSRGTAAAIEVVPERGGEYLLEVEDPASGHRAALFFRVSAWADAAAPGGEGVLSLSPDRERYRPGDTAELTLATPAAGRLLVTVEKDAELLSYDWVETDGARTSLRIPIDASYVPNVYVAVSLIQEHEQTLNDQPLRLYGVVPLEVEDPDTRLEVSIETPERLEPESPFSVSVAVSGAAAGGTTGGGLPRGEEAQLLVAVVDEGLLSLTNHPSPDPWNHFFAKRRLALESYDTLSQVIGAFQGDVFRVFSLGGGDEASAVRPEGRSRRRFEPVSLFQGPVPTDAEGRATLTFEMPNYLGGVRVMVVAVSGTRYGAAERTLPVTRPVVALPTLPRSLGPGERITLPVSLFRTDPAATDAEVRIRTNELLRLDGPAVQAVSFGASEQGGDSQREVSFALESAEAVGEGQIELTVVGGGERYTISRSVPLRSASPPVSERRRLTLETRGRGSVGFPPGGLPGTNRSSITLSVAGPVDLDERMAWLMGYPYGCLEQIVSAAFAQLFVPRAVDSSFDPGVLDRNIQGAIEGLRGFRLPSGAFSYWPGTAEVSAWGTNYAGHFLLEAESLGYFVPRELLDGWLSFQRSRAITTADTLIERVYRLYLLARAGEPAVGPMNLIRENAWNELSTAGKWFLAGAYHLAGYEEEANLLLSRAGTEVREYREFAGSYGSSLRDQAIILDIARETGRQALADRLFETVSGRLAADGWHSTQTTGYALMAISRYLTAVRRPGDEALTGRLVFPDGSTASFESRLPSVTVDLTEALYGGRGAAGGLPPAPRTGAPAGGPSASEVLVEVVSAPADRVFVVGFWEGTPLKAPGGTVSDGLEITSDWYDIEGAPLNVGSLLQGQEFWQIIRVRHQHPVHDILEELALRQIYPPGWEIVNPRLSGEAAPWWLDGSPTQPEYLDIRDDRASWFFDLSRSDGVATFAMRLRAVLPGEFSLPPVSIEAMYRDDVGARGPGREVEVLPR
jgi:alpha-2-macroglobulin